MIRLQLVFWNQLEEFYGRIEAIVRIELNAKNTGKAIPTVIYSFNIINWTFVEIKKRDTNIKKLITGQRMHHQRADMEHFYVANRENGERGWIQLKYLNKTDWMLQLLKTPKKLKKIYSFNEKTINLLINSNSCRKK